LANTWTSGPLKEETDPRVLEANFNKHLAQLKNRFAVPSWTFTSSDLTAATDHISHDFLFEFIKSIESKLDPGEDRPRIIPE